MKDKELKLNASGYYDEPCYQTIKNVDAPKPGEIYIHGDTGKYVLVLNCVNGVCAILNLTEQEREGRIPVMARVQMYTNPIMINYTFATTLTQYVKTITDEECLEVKKAVSEALGLLCIILDACEEVHQTRDKLEAEYDELLNENKSLKQHILDLNMERGEMLDKVKEMEGQRDKLIAEIGGFGDTIKKQAYELQAKEKNIIMLGESLAKVEREADKAEIYKEMYMTLLDKVISARGGKRK